MSHDSASPSRPSDSFNLEEQLVAYLDGELDEESARRVEHLLSTNSKVREALQRLERTWELLETLDQPAVEEKFTRSTLEMVVQTASEEVASQQAAMPRRWRRRWLIGTAGLLASGLVGFLAAALLWPDPNQQLLRDLPILEDLDQYRQIDDVEFLRALHREGLFVEEADDGA
jgi:anti-sigma factor RsiW